MMATTFKTLIDWPNGVGTLNANIAADAETIVLAADPGATMSASNFWVRIGYEQILVASRDGATLTCTGGRGASGTTAAAHSAGDVVTQDFLAGHVNAITTAVNAIETNGAFDALAVAGASTFGGGYGSTGASISAAGNIQTNGTLTVDGASTLTGAVALNNGTVTSTAETVTAFGTLTTALNLGATSVPIITIGHASGTTALNLKAVTVAVTGVITCTGGAAFGPIAGANTPMTITALGASSVSSISFRRATDAGSGVAGNTANDDVLGRVYGYGYANSDYRNAAYIGMRQDGNSSGNYVPGKIQLYTGTDAAVPAVALEIRADKTAKFTGAVGFNNTAPVAKPTITGSRGSNAALASLLTALAATGLLTDSTS